MAYDIKFLRGSQTTYEGLASKDDKTFYFTTETKDDKTIKRLYIGDVELSNSESETDIDALKARLDIAEANIGSTDALTESLKAAITRLDGADTVENSVAKKIKDAIELLDVDEFALTEDNNNVISIYGIKEVDGKIAKGTNKIDLAKVAKTGKAEDVNITAITGVTATDVQAALEALKGLIDSADSDAELILESQAGGSSDDFATKYTLYQGGKGEDGKHTEDSVKIGEITTAKDMVVESGSVKTVTEDGQPYDDAKKGDKYIDLVIANATSDHVYIPVKDLVDIYTGGENAEIKIEIDANNEITATVKKITATKIIYKEADTEAGTAEVTVKDQLDTIDTEIGDLGDLETTEKDNLVEAINEVRNSATGVTAVETPAASEGTDGSIKVTKKAADGTETVTYATPKNLKDVATTGKAEDVTFEADTDSGITATDVNAAILELEDDINGLDGNATIASKSGNVVTIKAGIAQTAGEIDNNSDADIVLDDVAVTGKAADLELEADTDSGLAAGSVQNFAQTVTEQLTWGTF